MTDREPTPDLRPPSSLLPRLSLGEWIVFAILAGVIAAANIYTTLLIGWGDTGSIVAVLAAVAMLTALGRRPTVYQLNLGQTMVSAGGGIGFAVASYAAIHIVRPDWDPNPYVLMALFAGTGILGAIVGTTVRRQMVRYFFPSGTACAVIQRAVTAELAPGERNRPVWLLKVWSLIAACATFPTKVMFGAADHAFIPVQSIPLGFSRLKELPIGVDPLFYGIGLVVGPRIGLGMVIGALLPGVLIVPALTTADGSEHAWGPAGEWVKWTAIAILTVPTFAAIAFAYAFKEPAYVPPGFTPGRTRYMRPLAQGPAHMALLVLGVGIASFAGHFIFGLPWFATLLTVVVAIPLSIVNGRVAGDTDINPVRLVAIVLLSAFFWLVSPDATVLLGMAVVGATIASVAVDMMQDYRTGHLLDQDPAHQTSVQFVGVVIGAIVSVPVLSMLIDEFGIGDGSMLNAPGAKVWASMAQAMAGEVTFTTPLIWGIVAVSAVGSVYAFLTVWPKTARWMPSLFGLGIGMLLGLDAAMAIFLGGVLKWIIVGNAGKYNSGEVREQRKRSAGDDTMIIGASIFAAGAVLSILLVILNVAFGWVDWYPWHLAGH